MIPNQKIFGKIFYALKINCRLNKNPQKKSYGIIEVNCYFPDLDGAFPSFAA